MSDYIDEAKKHLDNWLEILDVEEFIRQHEALNSYVPEPRIHSEFFKQLDDNLNNALNEVNDLTNHLKWQFYESDYNQPSKRFTQIQMDSLKAATTHYHNTLKMILEDQKRNDKE